MKYYHSWTGTNGGFAGEHQKHGIGSLLVIEGLKHCEKANYGAVVISVCHDLCSGHDFFSSKERGVVSARRCNEKITVNSSS